MQLPALNLSLTVPDLPLIRVARYGLIVVIVASVGCMGWLMYDSRTMVEQAVGYERATERVERLNREYRENAQRNGIALSEARAKAQHHEMTAVTQILATRAFSWTQLLTDLEEAVPANLALSSVALNFKDALITLNGSALTLEDLTGFVARLENHPAFQNVVLSQHRIEEPTAHTASHTQSLEPGRTIEFTMTVVYHRSS